MRHYLFAMLVIFTLASSVTAVERPAWASPMQKVHDKFNGKPGTLALFGDSITMSKAFWSPLAHPPRDFPEPLAKNLAVVKKHMQEDCWSKWRGPEYGSQSGQTTKWADENVDTWLRKLNPEVAVVMFGSNDLTRGNEKEYDRDTRSVVEKCLKNGTIVILTTIPPRAGLEKKAAAFAAVQRKVAADMNVPLIDFHAEILKLRPDDWNSSLAQFKLDGAKDAYQVPTLIAGDGIHPSNPAKYQDYSTESMKRNGYQLRNVMTLTAYAEVIREVLADKK